MLVIINILKLYQYSRKIIKYSFHMKYNYFYNGFSSNIRVTIMLTYNIDLQKLRSYLLKK